MEFKFTIPGRLPGLNEIIAMNHSFYSRGGRRHYHYHGIKAEVEERITIAALSALGRKSGVGGFGPYRVEILWAEENEKRDPDNIAAGTKFILDALVKNCLIGGDGRKYVSSIHHRFSTDRADPRVEVKLINEGICYADI